MANLHEIALFPNPGVRLVKEDEHIAVWEEEFEPGNPAPPHRHMRDYVATVNRPVHWHRGEWRVHGLGFD